MTLVIDEEHRSITIFPSEPGNLPTETIDHLLFDQAVPRIRAHLGELMIHAAAVSIGNDALLLVGDSGRGKSTLSASLAGNGCTLLGDDAVGLAVDGAKVLAKALYPSLRLLPDSISAVIKADVPTSSTAHYTIKQRVHVGAGGPEASCRAIFVLDAPQSATADIRTRRLSPGDTCLALLKESFALDPSDTKRAATRLRAAGEVAERVPGFSLCYPRAYDRLPDVIDAVLGTAGMK